MRRILNILFLLTASFFLSPTQGQVVLPAVSSPRGPDISDIEALWGDATLEERVDLLESVRARCYNSLAASPTALDFFAKALSGKEPALRKEALVKIDMLPAPAAGPGYGYSEWLIQVLTRAVGAHPDFIAGVKRLSDELAARSRAHKRLDPELIGLMNHPDPSVAECVRDNLLDLIPYLTQPSQAAALVIIYKSLGLPKPRFPKKFEPAAWIASQVHWQITLSYQWPHWVQVSRLAAQIGLLERIFQENHFDIRQRLVAARVLYRIHQFGLSNLAQGIELQRRATRTLLSCGIRREEELERLENLEELFYYGDCRDR